MAFSTSLIERNSDYVSLEDDYDLPDLESFEQENSPHKSPLKVDKFKTDASSKKSFSEIKIPMDDDDDDIMVCNVFSQILGNSKPITPLNKKSREPLKTVSLTKNNPSTGTSFIDLTNDSSFKRSRANSVLNESSVSSIGNSVQTVSKNLNSQNAKNSVINIGGAYSKKGKRNESILSYFPSQSKNSSNNIIPQISMLGSSSDPKIKTGCSDLNNESKLVSVENNKNKNSSIVTTHKTVTILPSNNISTLESSCNSKNNLPQTSGINKTIIVNSASHQVEYDKPDNVRASINSVINSVNTSESGLEILRNILADMESKTQLSWRISRYLKCTHMYKSKSKRWNSFSDMGICPICCWPYSSPEKAFYSENIQVKMIEKIQRFVTDMGRDAIVKVLIKFLQKNIQKKILNILTVKQTVPPTPNQTDAADDLEEDELGIAETFSDYKPSKLQIGHPHPDCVVETASLSSVEPPDITYTLSIPSDMIEERRLSALQLETITYASQRFEYFLPDGNRAGFLVGDGAGVGKGRTIAGVIFENFLKGRRKSIWVSVSNDLKFDAERDLKDIGAHDVSVHYLSKLPYGKIKDIEAGVLFMTYTALIGHTRVNKVNSVYGSRLTQMVDWCGEDFDGCIIFDECHKAKNLIAVAGRKPTKTGLAVLDLQKRLPKARVFYASATGASEPKDLAYMIRLGIWGPNTPFPEFEYLKGAVDKRGVGAMEIIALDMKLRGCYLARQLSFQGVTFRIEEVKLEDGFKEVYDVSCQMWMKAMKLYEIIAELDTATVRMMWALFWAAHQRFFKYLCIGTKVEHAVQLSKKAIEEGKCVVIGLQMTGEASTMEALRQDGEISSFISTAKSVFQTVINKFSEEDIESFGNLVTDPLPRTGRPSSTGFREREKKVEQALKLRRSLVNDFEKIGPRLPPSTLDQLIHQLGGAEKVAEMTGRKGRVAEDLNGEVTYTVRCEVDEELDMVNMNEKKRFMDGVKEVAIISEAASSGISLQSDRRVKNQKKRVHITLELPWSADRAIQQFGRTHRSNQTNAPEYVFLISELAGEKRFASVVAKRLECLGALTHGDRRATESRDLSSFHIDNKYGRRALGSSLDAFTELRPPLVPPPSDYPGNFFLDVSKVLNNVGMTYYDEARRTYQAEKESRTVQKFLNRILGVPVDLQNRIFCYFSDTLDAIIQEEKRMGRYDLGILDLGLGGQSCHPVESVKWTVKHTTGESEIVLNTILVERGISWKEAMEKYATCTKSAVEGFYIAHMERHGKKHVILTIMDTSGTNRFREKRSQPFIILRPNTGQGKSMVYHELLKKYRKVTPKEAERHWESLYKHTENNCQHSYWSGFCVHVSRGQTCSVGRRSIKYFILCGAILNVWTAIEEAFVNAPTAYSRVQVIRLKTFDGKKLVGTLIPNGLVQSLRSLLDEKLDNSEADCSEFETYNKCPEAKLENLLNTYNELYMKSGPSKPPRTAKRKTSQGFNRDAKRARYQRNYNKLSTMAKEEPDISLPL